MNIKRNKLQLYSTRECKEIKSDCGGANSMSRYTGDLFYCKLQAVIPESPGDGLLVASAMSSTSRDIVMQTCI